MKSRRSDTVAFFGLYGMSISYRMQVGSMNPKSENHIVRIKGHCEMETENFFLLT